LQLAAVERGYVRSRNAVLNQVVAVPPVFIANEAEELIDDASAVLTLKHLHRIASCLLLAALISGPSKTF
jgi:hypothetical protein